MRQLLLHAYIMVMQILKSILCLHEPFILFTLNYGLLRQNICSIVTMVLSTCAVVNDVFRRGARVPLPLMQPVSYQNISESEI